MNYLGHNSVDGIILGTQFAEKKLLIVTQTFHNLGLVKGVKTTNGMSAVLNLMGHEDLNFDQYATGNGKLYVKGRHGDSELLSHWVFSKLYPLIARYSVGLYL